MYHHFHSFSSFSVLFLPFCSSTFEILAGRISSISALRPADTSLHVVGWWNLLNGILLHCVVTLPVLHPGKFTFWTQKMEVWNMIFLFNWVICRFQPLIFQGVLEYTQLHTLQDRWMGIQLAMFNRWSYQFQPLLLKSNTIMINLISDTLPETNSKFAPENRPFAPKGNEKVFQASMFRCFCCWFQGG